MLIFGYMKDIIKSAGKETGFFIFCKLVDILGFFGEVFFIQRMIDFVFLEGKEVEVIFYAICVFSIFIWQYSSPALSVHIEQKILFRYRMKLEAKIYEKISKVKFEYFENSAILEVMNRILDNPADRMVSSLGKILEIISGAVSTIGVMAIIVKIGVAYMIGIIVLILFLLFLFQQIGKIKSNIFCARMELTRRETYLSGLLFDRELAMEKKLFGYTDYIQKKIEEEIFQNEKPLRWKLWQSRIITALYDYFVYLFSASAYLFFLVPLMQGKMELGFYIAIIPALQKIGKYFVGLIDNQLSDLKGNESFCKDIHDVFQLEEQYYENKEMMRKDFSVIELKDVTYRYPNAERPIIEKLNLKLEQGHHYALVGKNGSGKTTLIKLLLGLYQPQEGAIFLDGQNIKELSFEELQSRFSVIFQDFGRYAMSIKENIEMGVGSFEGEAEKMQEACAFAGIKEEIEKLPEGYETKLGKLKENSVDLSGGQWQKLAVARMYYSQKPFYILDEPTSALDPVSESEMYTNYANSLKGNSTSLFVSHRLGSTMLADKILVLEDGKIKEMGSHQELINKNGIYAKMFLAQRGLYV